MVPWEDKDGVIYFKERIFLPKNSPSISIIIDQFHNDTHEGFQKTYHRVITVFYW